MENLFYMANIYNITSITFLNYFAVIILTIIEIQVNIVINITFNDYKKEHIAPQKGY